MSSSVFVDYLLGLIGHARTSFSIDQTVAKIIDPNFVPKARYAELLIEGIPARNLLNVTLAVFQSKGSTQGKKLRYVFDVAIPKLSDAEADELFAAISEELATSSDDNALTSVFALLDPKYWAKLGEAARLRSENRIVANIRQGLYSKPSDKCSGGALATWTPDFWPHFTLKRELLWALNGRLSSGVKDAQDYVFQFFNLRIPSLADVPPPWLEETLINALAAGDARFKEFVDYLEWSEWEGSLSDKLKAALAAFQPKESTDEDDIPF